MNATMQHALHHLHNLLAQGGEFPDAAWAAATKYGVSLDELKRNYDNPEGLNDDEEADARRSTEGGAAEIRTEEAAPTAIQQGPSENACAPRPGGASEPDTGSTEARASARDQGQHDLNERDYEVSENVNLAEAGMRFHELRGYIGTAYAKKHNLMAKHHREELLKILGLKIK